MFSSENLSFLKNKMIYFILFIYILSFFFEHYFKFEFKFVRFSIVETIFLILFFFTLITFKLDFIKFILKFDKKNIFEIIIYIFLILKLIKYLLDFNNYYNLYELFIWIYMVSIYTLFKFYLTNDKNLIYYIENSFIAVSLIISSHIIYSFFLFKLGHESNVLWMIRDTTHYPYAGISSINFKSLFMDYNQPAHLVAPGYLFLFSRFNNKLIFILLIFFYFLIFYLIKSKFLIIFFSILGIYLISKNLTMQNKKLTKFFILFSIIILSIFYFVVTHFLILEKGTINSSNFELFKHYFYTDIKYSINKYDIYGSLFLKTKFTAIEVANSFNYIFFDSSNYFNNNIVLKNFDNYTDPHSDYFSALANYGIIGFIVFLAFPVYTIFNYLKNFNLKILSNNSFIYFLIIIMIFIESIVVDLFHTQFIWILFAMYILSSKIKKSLS